MITSGTDREATAAARFLDSKSYVTIGGQTFRYGADMGVLREQCFRRDGWICYRCGGHIRYGDEDLEHIVARSEGGDDSLENVAMIHGMFAQQSCHRDEHPRTLAQPKIEQPTFLCGLCPAKKYTVDAMDAHRREWHRGESNGA